jgi:hypothetical protein
LSGLVKRPSSSKNIDRHSSGRGSEAERCGQGRKRRP